MGMGLLVIINHAFRLYQLKLMDSERELHTIFNSDDKECDETDDLPSSPRLTPSMSRKSPKPTGGCCSGGQCSLTSNSFTIQSVSRKR